MVVLCGLGTLLGASAAPASAAVGPVRSAGPVLALGTRSPSPSGGVPSPSGTRRMPDPIEVTPDWHDLPGRDRIMDLLDTASQVALACCIAVAIIGGAALGIGRVSGSGPGGVRGMGMLLGGGGGAIVIVYAPDLISWLAQ
ncbi:hypothetical protein ThrDRAFT_03224 [Frankia casuarinae]|nr:hypothetical protein ThrDRAFT_03224 [Frankia casuarinae]KDA41629.1 hypothetical protein BMG523Draft_03567 [Frankia sp. BMG5.23]